MSSPKTLAEMAEEWARPRCEDGGYIQWHAMMQAEIESFMAGARAALKLPEVLAMREALAHSEHTEWGSKALAGFDRLTGEVGK